MKTKVLWALALLNAVLATSLFMRFTRENAAVAQVNAQKRIGDVIMIPGEVSGGASAVVYLVDVQNHQLSAMAFDGQSLNFMAPLALDRLFEGGATPTGTTPPRGRTGTGTGLH